MVWSSRNMKESAWSSKCRTFRVTDSFPRRWPRKTWNKVIRSDLKKKKASKDLAKDWNAWKPFIRNCLMMSLSQPPSPVGTSWYGEATWRGTTWYWGQLWCIMVNCTNKNNENIDFKTLPKANILIFGFLVSLIWGEFNK